MTHLKWLGPYLIHGTRTASSELSRHHKSFALHYHYTTADAAADASCNEVPRNMQAQVHAALLHNCVIAGCCRCACVARGLDLLVHWYTLACISAGGLLRCRCNCNCRGATLARCNAEAYTKSAHTTCPRNNLLLLAWALAGTGNTCASPLLHPSRQRHALPRAQSPSQAGATGQETSKAVGRPSWASCRCRPCAAGGRRCCPAWPRCSCSTCGTSPRNALQGSKAGRQAGGQAGESWGGAACAPERGGAGLARLKLLQPLPQPSPPAQRCQHSRHLRSSPAPTCARLAAHEDRVGGGAARVVAHALEQVAVRHAGGGKEDLAKGRQRAGGQVRGGPGWCGGVGAGAGGAGMPQQQQQQQPGPPTSSPLTRSSMVSTCCRS